MRADSPTRIARPWPGVVALAVLSIVSGGCSFIFVTPPREQLPDHGASECTTVAAAPVVDLLLAGAEVGSALYVAQKSDGSGNSGVALGVGLSIASLFAISAVYGLRHTICCTELQGEPEEPIRPRRPRGRARPIMAPTPVSAPAATAPPVRQQLDSE